MGPRSTQENKDKETSKSLRAVACKKKDRMVRGTRRDEWREKIPL
jgi:hypothetical protein